MNTDPRWDWSASQTCKSFTRIKGRIVHCEATHSTGLHIAAHPITKNPVFWGKGLERADA